MCSLKIRSGRDQTRISIETLLSLQQRLECRAVHSFLCFHRVEFSLHFSYFCIDQREAWTRRINIVFIVATSRVKRAVCCNTSILQCWIQSADSTFPYVLRLQSSDLRLQSQSCRMKKLSNSPICDFLLKSAIAICRHGCVDLLFYIASHTLRGLFITSVCQTISGQGQRHCV